MHTHIHILYTYVPPPPLPPSLPSSSPCSPARDACSFARSQRLGFKVWGGNHKSGARFARSRPAVTRPNPKPQSLLAAVTNPTLLHTLTLTVTLTLTLKP